MSGLASRARRIFFDKDIRLTYMSKHDQSFVALGDRGPCPKVAFQDESDHVVDAPFSRLRKW